MQPALLDYYHGCRSRLLFGGWRGMNAVMRIVALSIVAGVLLAGACVSPGGTAEMSGRQIAEFERRLAAVEQQLDQSSQVPRVVVPDGGTVISGPEDAAVVIVEFSDFECPFCARLQPTLAEIRSAYGDQVRTVYRHFPLTEIHPNAWKAAEAALCARDQGAFVAMHHAMFEEQGALDEANLQGIARGLGLDGGAFDECLGSGRYASEVGADFDAGVAAGVAGTPTMFINGVKVEGALPVGQIQEVIDRELASR